MNNAEMQKLAAQQEQDEDGKQTRHAEVKDTTPDWTKKCEVCDCSPIVPLTGMCGPCTFGEADTAGGNW